MGRFLLIKTNLFKEKRFQSFNELLPYKFTELLLIFAIISFTSGLTRNSGGRYTQMAQENNNLLIIGAGQYGHLALEIARAMGCFGKIAFLDDLYKAPEAIHDDEPSIIGTARDIEKFASQFHYGFVAIGNPQVRARLVEQLKFSCITPATLIHPTAYVSPSARLQQGCCVEPNATVQTGAVLGKATFVASGAVIRHDATVGDFCHIDCNAVVESGAVVPASTKVSCNSVFAKAQEATRGVLEDLV